MIILCILTMYQIQTQTRGGSTGEAQEQEPAGGHEWQMMNDDKHCRQMQPAGDSDQ